MLADWQVCGHDEGMVEPFRIHLGDRAPVRQSQVTCGSTSLTVARMLVDPLFAREVVEGGAHGCDLPGGNTRDGRLGAIERTVMARTNSLVGPGGRWQLPWPRRLGTPPWGARRELEDGAADVGARYEVAWCRLGGEERLRRHHGEIRQRVREGRPAILYIGNRWLPRHVTLVIAPESGEGLAVYDPAVGRVQELPADAFAGRRLGMAGWDVPWCVVQPRPDQAGMTTASFPGRPVQ